MAFGPKQINNPTPRSKSILMDFLVGFCSVLSGFLTGASFIPHTWSDPLSTTLSTLIVPTLLLAKRMFGEEINRTSVNIDQVTEIKDK